MAAFLNTSDTEIGWSFDNTSGVSVTGTGASSAQSTLFTKVSTESVYVATGAGNIAEVRAANIDTTNVISLGYWVYIPDATKVDNVIVYVGETNFASFDTKTYDVDAGTKYGYNGWYFFGGPMQEFPNADTKAYWKDGLNDTKIRITPVSGQVAEAYVDSIIINWRGVPQLSIVFDDSLSSQYDALSDLSSRSLLATYATIQSTVEGGAAITEAQLQEIAQTHEVCGHDTVDLTTLTAAGVEGRIRETQKYLTRLGVNNAPDVYVYPFGSWDSNVISGAQNAGIKCARDVGGAGGYSGSYLEMSDIDRDGLIRPFMYRPIVGFNSQTLSQVQNELDNFISFGGHACLMFHDIIAGSSSGTSINETDFTDLLDYLVVLRTKGLIDIVPLQAWYDRTIKILPRILV